MTVRVPPALQQLWDQGHQVEAIKRLRQQSALDVREAMDLLTRGAAPAAAHAPQAVREVAASGAPAAPTAPSARLSDGQAAVVALLMGNPIEAVRRARAAAEAPVATPAQAAPQAPPPLATESALPPELISQDPNRAPGEQPPGFFSGPPGLLRLIALGGALLQAWLLWSAL